MGGTRARLVAYDDQPVGAGFAAPGFAGSAQHLTNVGASLVARIGLVGFCGRVEALNCIGLPVGRPDAILVVDIDRIGAALALRHRVMRPGLPGWIVFAET